MTTDVTTKAWKDLERNWAHRPREAFMVYAVTLFSTWANGRLSTEDLAVSLAHAMFLPNLDRDPLLEEITMVAGELEMPRSPAEQQVLLRHLTEMLQELSR